MGVLAPFYEMVGKNKEFQAECDWVGLHQLQQPQHHKADHSWRKASMPSYLPWKEGRSRGQLVGGVILKQMKHSWLSKETTHEHTSSKMSLCHSTHKM